MARTARRTTGITAALLLLLAPPASAGPSSADFPRVGIPSTTGGSVEVLDTHVLIPPTTEAYVGAGVVTAETDRRSGGDPHVKVTQEDIPCATGVGLLWVTLTTYQARYAGTVTISTATNLAGLDNGPLDQDMTPGWFVHSRAVESAPEYTGAPSERNVLKVCVTQPVG